MFVLLFCFIFFFLLCMCSEHSERYDKWATASSSQVSPYCSSECAEILRQVCFSSGNYTICTKYFIPKVLVIKLVWEIQRKVIPFYSVQQSVGRDYLKDLILEIAIRVFIFTYKLAPCEHAYCSDSQHWKTAYTCGKVIAMETQKEWGNCFAPCPNDSGIFVCQCLASTSSLPG